jgi:hypothetical protein
MHAKTDTMTMLRFVILLTVVASTYANGQSTPVHAADSDPSLPIGMHIVSNTMYEYSNGTSNGGNIVTIDAPQENFNTKYELPSALQANSNCFIDNFIRGFGFDSNSVENNGFRFIPADSSGAAGAERLVAVVNVMIEVRRKDGILTYRDGFKDFFRFLEHHNQEANSLILRWFTMSMLNGLLSSCSKEMIPHCQDF